jgi:hypothetical protein
MTFATIKLEVKEQKTTETKETNVVIHEIIVKTRCQHRDQGSMPLTSRGVNGKRDRRTAEALWRSKKTSSTEPSASGSRS